MVFLCYGVGRCTLIRFMGYDVNTRESSRVKSIEDDKETIQVV